jgi:DNA primase
MKVDERFHCFGCRADGDVIDFTARLFDISLKAAAEKLVTDFNISCDGQTPKQSRPKASLVTAKRSLMQRIKTIRT